MTTTEELAKIAYHAWGEAAGWISFYSDLPLMRWDELNDKGRNSWIAAQEAARQHLGDDIQAYEPAAHPLVGSPEIAYQAAQERMEAIVRNN